MGNWKKNFLWGNQLVSKLMEEKTKYADFNEACTGLNKHRVIGTRSLTALLSSMVSQEALLIHASITKRTTKTSQLWQYGWTTDYYAAEGHRRFSLQQF